MIQNVLLLSIHAFNSYIQINEQYKTNISYDYMDYQHVQTINSIQSLRTSIVKNSRLLE